MKRIICGFEIEEIKRSSRKSIGLEINDKAQIIIRAPHDMSLQRLEEVVKIKKQWLFANLAKMRERKKNFATEKLEFGSKIWYLGEKITLKPAKSNRELFYFDGNLFMAEQLLPHAGRVLYAWYREVLIPVIEEIIEPYIHQYRFPVRKYKISHAERRWGSCSTLGTLNFSYRLAMLPKNIITYVIVHELVHLWQPNHSGDFWKNLESFLPDYKNRRQWLKTNGHLFRIPK